MKKPPKDPTRAERFARHEEKLKVVNGQRVPVDLDGHRLDKIKRLIKAGYANNRSDVIRRSIDEVPEPDGKDD